MGKPSQSMLEQYLSQYVTDGNPHVLAYDNLGMELSTVTLDLELSAVSTSARNGPLWSSQWPSRYGHVPHNDFSVSDGPHIRRWFL